MIFGGIHATLYPDRSAATRRRTRRCGRRRRRSLGKGICSDRSRRACRNRFTSAARLEASDFVQAPLGPDSRVTATCGLQCRPFAVVPSIVHFVQCGAPMGNGPGNVLPTLVIRRNCANCAGLAFASLLLADDNFYPVTLTDFRTWPLKQNNAYWRLHELPNPPC